MNMKIYAPDLGKDEVEVTEILVKIGDEVQVEQSILVVEGDKASIEIPSPMKGIVIDIKVNVGDKINSGDFLMTFEVSDKENKINNIQNVLDSSSETKINNIQNVLDSSSETKINNIQNVLDSSSEKSNIYQSNIYATPTVRRLARKFNINLSKINGTGRKGRILIEDIDCYITNIISKMENLPYKKNLTYDNQKNGDIEEIKLGKIQKISGDNLSKNWFTIPHVTQFDEVNITELEIFRKQQNDQHKLKITLPIFLMKAVSKALEQFPLFNSSLSENKETIILKKYINIGLAVNTPNGLLVPVLRNINKKGIIQLTNEVIEVVNKARENRLSFSDLQEGCFTISSLGGIGGKFFTPIINAPEVAILGVSQTSYQPIWNGKEFIPKLMLPLSLSYDHRIINGVDGVNFLNYIKKILLDIRCLIM